MEFIGKLVDFVLHLDVHLNALIATYQLWTYLILFVVIFCETGLVVTPFLPGDSLLFAAGALAATPGSPLRVHWLFLVLCGGGRHRRHGQLLDRPCRRPQDLQPEKDPLFEKGTPGENPRFL